MTDDEYTINAAIIDVLTNTFRSANIVLPSDRLSCHYEKSLQLCFGSLRLWRTWVVLTSDSQNRIVEWKYLPSGVHPAAWSHTEDTHSASSFIDSALTKSTQEKWSKHKNWEFTGHKVSSRHNLPLSAFAFIHPPSLFTKARDCNK